MRKRVRRRHDAHIRVQNVCADHNALFDATPGGQKTRAALAAHIADVDRLLVLQGQSIADRRAAADQSRVSRRRLRNAAKSVVSVGKMVVVDAATMRTLQLPGPATDDELLAYSRTLLARVSAHADAFVAEGLPPDLLKNLETGIAEFAAARDTQAAGRQRFSAAFEAIQEALDEADKAVDVLEGIALNTPAASPEVVTELRMAKRIGPRIATPAPTSPQATPTGKAA